MKCRYETIAVKLKSLLTSSRKVMICLDGWTKKGMSASYLGISASFFDQRRRVPCHALLSLAELEHPHTGQMLSACLANCLDTWSIPSSKVLLIISDNGANKVKAVRLLQQKEKLRQAQDTREQNEDEETDNISSSEEVEDINDDNDGEN